MATKLTRAVTRETAELDGKTGKPYLIRLDEGGTTVSIKVKGSRTWYTTTVLKIFNACIGDLTAKAMAEKNAGKRVMVDRGKL